MAIPNSNINELLTTTIQKYSPKLADNVSKSNAILFRMQEKGNVQQLDGGESILENLMYQENGTWKWYNGYETLDISAQDVLSSAQFEWKQGNVNVTISGRELRINEGSSTRMHDLIKSRIMVAEATAKNQVAESMFSDGTTDPKAIGGLRLLVADDPTTGTVGGINRATHAFWRNKIYDFSTESVTASSTTMVGSMGVMWRRCVRGTDKPDLIVMGETYYGYYEAALTSLKRFQMADTKLADAGFTSLKYNDTADVIFDSNCGTTRAYFLNTDHLKLKVHRSANFSLESEKVSVNQDAYVYPLLFMGNMTCSNCSLQGVMQP